MTMNTGRQLGRDQLQISFDNIEAEVQRRVT
jgi:hypothetical protein